MPLTEAQKRAKRNYSKSDHVTKVTFEFYPADEPILSHLKRQENKQGYVKNLIKQDMMKEKGHP